MTEQLETKAAFARRLGISDVRVSQYIKSGIIGPDALEGEGRKAMIRVHLALRQVAQRRHPIQAAVNGAATQLNEAGGEPVDEMVPAAAPGGVDHGAGAKATENLTREIQVERLEGERRRNRRAAMEEAVALGRLVAVDDLRQAIAKTTSQCIGIFVGMAPDIANAIAAEFKVPQRDVLAVVRNITTQKRAQATTALRLAADELPEEVEAEIDGLESTEGAQS